ncbi:probable transmembrane reductase CYB561D1 isoform X1 [Periophthalmus magnuspinnatus]|uniref:probable transmembrane reductase CYB561D1 isoform X1 n=1 Tax=Periophthalmus magnuspinnatus TaxID=409849 RepID=UPI00145A172F|nr:probable transmembrane reductase CYB561D1 isoform X1 [Periophthalmus magnuspinnatus]
MPADVEYSPVGKGLEMQESRLYVWMRRVAVIAAHATGLGLVVTIFVLSRPGTSLFSWHPVCMSVAYWLCLTEGLLLFGEGSLYCCKSRSHKVCMHLCCQAAELVFAITGLGFMVASKNRSELPHLVSWHSVLGLCTLVVTALQAACGLCVHFPKQQQILLYPSKLKLYHTTLGLVVYFLATVTILSAMFSDWFQATVRGVGWWALLLLPLLPALVVMNQIINSHLPHKKITI